MLNLIQHLIISSDTYEILKQVQDDKLMTFYETIISYLDFFLLIG